MSFCCFIHFRGQVQHVVPEASCPSSVQQEMRRFCLIMDEILNILYNVVQFFDIFTCVNCCLYWFRSFPGVVQMWRVKGTSKLVPMKRKAPKAVVMTFCLLPRMTSKTPKESDKLKMNQAGLGKRSILVNDNISHAEVCASGSNMLELILGVHTHIVNTFCLYSCLRSWVFTSRK